MGLRMFSGKGPNSLLSPPRKFSCGTPTPNPADTRYETPDGQPRPYRYEVLKFEVVNDFIVVVMLNYPDCTTWNGNKIAVYHVKDWDKVNLAGKIDPHFLENNASPMARFRPTDIGWNLAITLAKHM